MIHRDGSITIDGPRFSVVVDTVRESFRITKQDTSVISYLHTGGLRIGVNGIPIRVRSCNYPDIMLEPRRGTGLLSNYEYYVYIRGDVASLDDHDVHKPASISFPIFLKIICEVFIALNAFASTDADSIRDACTEYLSKYVSKSSNIKRSRIPTNARLILV